MATADEAKKSADDKAPKTAGQRLAAAKAAKAAAKAAKRGREAELRESKALKKAEVAGDWARRNRRTLYIALGVVVVVIAGATAWSIHSESQAQEASSVLWDAVETARAEVAPEGQAADPDSDTTTYQSVEARAERAAERYQKVMEQYPDTPAAVWARLGEGNANYQMGEQAAAREAYQQALAEGGDDPVVAWRALEGIGFTYEAEEAWDEAIERFQQLGNEADGAWKDVADYHVARMHLAKGDEERAKELLRELVERLRGEREDEPELDYVLAQAEIRLQALDSSLVPRETSPFPGGAGGFGMGAGGGGGTVTGGGDLGDLTPEQLQQLIQQMQKRQQGGGAPPGGGAPQGGGTPAGGGE